ncbi:MAG: YidB family protein [Smithellaceae bacterium]
MQNLTAKVGISPDELRAILSGFLPTAIDKLTPDGSIPLY